MRVPEEDLTRTFALPRSVGLLPLELREVDRFVAIEDALDLRQWIFEPCRTIKQHHPIALGNTTFGEALLVGGICCGALGTEQKPLLARDFVERSGNLLVGHSNGKSLALAHRTQDEKIADRLRHADAGGDGMGILPARGVLGACFKSA